MGTNCNCRGITCVNARSLETHRTSSRSHSGSSQSGPNFIRTVLVFSLTLRTSQLNVLQSLAKRRPNSIALQVQPSTSLSGRCLKRLQQRSAEVASAAFRTEAVGAPSSLGRCSFSVSVPQSARSAIVREFLWTAERNKHIKTHCTIFVSPQAC